MSENGHRTDIHDTILDSDSTSGHQGIDMMLTTLINNVHQELKQYGDSVTRQELRTLVSRITEIKNLMLVQSKIPLQI